MQHAQLAVLLMEQTSQHPIEFPTEDREHRRRLELARDSLLRRPGVRDAKPQGA